MSVTDERESPPPAGGSPAGAGEPELPPDPDFGQEPEQGGGRFGFIPDLIKRTFYAGLGAVFTTEEGIRKLAGDLHLPKEVAAHLINQASATKNELFRIVGKEVRGFLENLNLAEELQRLLTQLSFEIRTEIRFVPNDEALVKPEIKRSVSVKSKDKPSAGSSRSDSTPAKNEPGVEPKP